MAQFRDFPNIEIPDWAVALGFTDQSWGNDAAARLERPWHYGTSLVLWASYKDPQQRELIQMYEPQFTLVICAEDNTQNCVVFQAEDIDKMRRFLEALFTTDNVPPT